MQRQLMRLAFFAGAEHLFSCMMGTLDPGKEPTKADMRRMDLLHEELQRWRRTEAQVFTPAQGNA